MATRRPIAALVLMLVGCASGSARIHQHEAQRAAYEAQGLHDAAEGERLRANREREQVSRGQNMIFARDDR